jgi:hypothetical protein
MPTQLGACLEVYGPESRLSNNGPWAFWLARAPGTAGGFPVQVHAGGQQPVKPVTTRPAEAPVDSAPADHGYSGG